MQFRLTAGTHVGPDLEGVTRMWTAKSGHDIIDTHQDLNTLNARGFPPKFQPLSASPHDEAGLLAKKAEIEQQLATLRDYRAQTPAPVADGAPRAPDMVKDPRDSVAPATAAREAVRVARETAVHGVMDACERMTDVELREYCEAEEIPVDEDTTKAEMLELVARKYS